MHAEATLSPEECHRCEKENNRGTCTYKAFGDQAFVE